ncbi:sulfatase-like hydrolase/transferase [Flammeovirga pacifica]|uniref:N-acetylgalactosamine 6-sulfate sulfatase n=1 Tax=Flammeovirga pacifica TaxID=915059 RepID=A0A1S1YS07_FLAPC|nr:sulfatase-like hydrolase/transferase [Flammeovirga pacifica]OHX63814.1 N-acetylgalactosamine 6-sulfate sulfatase [Flammeovirga pacifica]
MKGLITYFTITLCIITAFSCSQIKKAKTKNSEKPNVIIILTDDQGYGDVSFNGSTEISTPHIDRIAYEGVKFNNGYVTYAVCGPSRMGLITGRYQDRFGGSRNPLWAPNDINQGLPLSEETMADVLGKEGYKSIAIGKWHLGAHNDLRPLNRGFDEFYGFLTGGHKYFPEEWTLSDISQVKSQFDAYRTKLLRNNTRVEEQEYLTDALSREAVDFIDRNSQKPFFMYLAYNAPHAPLQATEKYLNRFKNVSDIKRRTYLAMVSAVDDGVGQILSKLEDKGIDDNTMIFFLSDNGGAIKNASYNGELSGWKGSLFEGGIHVPFALRWPKMIQKGVEYNPMISSLDIMATAVAFSEAKPTNNLDGVNIVPFIRGDVKGVPHEALFWRKFDDKDYAVRQGELKYLSIKDRKTNVRTTSYFDLQNDLSEKNNLSDLEEKQKESLIRKYKKWEGDMMMPKYLGLLQNSEYTSLNPNRFVTEVY